MRCRRTVYEPKPCQSTPEVKSVEGVKEVEGVEEDLDRKSLRLFDPFDLFDAPSRQRCQRGRRSRSGPGSEISSTFDPFDLFDVELVGRHSWSVVNAEPLRDH